MQNNEANFLNLAESLQNGLLIVDPNGHHLYANRFAGKTLGYTKEELLLTTMKDLADPAELPMLRQRLVDRLAGLPVPETYETIVRRKDGSSFPAQVTGTPIAWHGELCDLVQFQDITERKVLEEELRKSRKDLATLIDNMPGIVYTCGNDPDWTMLFISEGSVELTGYKPDEIIQNRVVSYNKIIHPADRQRVWETIQKKVKSHEPFDLEYRIRTKTNTIKHVWERGRGTFNRFGILEQLDGFITDVTLKKKTEEQLKANYSLIRMAGKTAKFGGWRVDLEDGIVHWSDEVSAIHEMSAGFTPTVGKGIAFYAPEWRERIAAFFTRCAEAGIPYDEEMEIITGKGNRRWIRTTGEAVRNAEGKIIHVYGSFQDIHEQKITQEPFRKSESKFRTSVEVLLDAFGIYTAVRDSENKITDFRIEYVNQTACLLNNLSREDQIGNLLCEIIPAHRVTGLFDDYVHLVETGEVINREIAEFKSQNGTEVLQRVFEIRASKFEDGFVVTWRDITERKKAEEQIRMNELRLNELIATKDKFFSILAHDLRSPFNGFMGLTQVMAEELPNLTMLELQRMALTMSNSAVNLYRLLENLLQWSQVQSNSIPFHPVSHKLSSLVRESIEMIHENARIKDVEIAVEISDTLTVVADSNLTESVIRNLVSNAIKFTSSGGRILIHANKKEGRMIEISVRDTGIGMNAEIIGSLFRIDVRVNRKGTKGEPSTGLGLMLCKEFVGMHGGTIRAESEEGRGSTFYFTLPSADPEVNP